jgi:uncharacterized protein YgiM (DUF1202 family)
MTIQTINRHARQRLPRWKALLVLCPVVLLLAGCALQPIVAGPAQQLPATPAHPAPVLAIAPTSGAAGTQITASSAGWQPSEVVSLEVAVIQAGNAVTTTITTAAADNDGRINATFFLPLTASESDLPQVAIIARSLTTHEKALASFTVSKETSTITPTLTITTPTVTPQPATATPTASATSSAVTPLTHVTSAGLNMRAGPSTAYGVLRSLQRNAEMTVIGQSSDNGWLYVRLSDGLLGWVARSFTDFTSTAPIVQAPPLPSVPTAAPTPTPTYTPAPSISDWRAEYYTNKSLLNAPLIVRNETNLDFDWGYGSPGNGILGDGFSARWTRSLYFDGGTYRFNVLTDDGARVWLDGNLIIDQWHDGAATTYSSDQGLGSGNHSLRVEYYENSGTARLRFWWDRIDTANNDFPDWKGRYWSNRKLEGDATLVRNDSKINFNWGNGSPDDRLPDNNFSARWTREVDFKRGLYRFYAKADDGIRVWIDDDRVIDQWHDNDYDTVYTFDRLLKDDHDLKVEYFEHNGGARVKFWWERIADQPTATPTLTATPQPPTNTPTSPPPPTPTFTPTPTRNANANVSPSAGGANTRITVTGSGFPANVAVHAYLGGLVEASALSAAKPQPYANATTDSKGAYSMSFVLPDKWPNGTPIQPGQVVILVATDNFSLEASAPFEVRAPQPTKAPKPYAQVEPNKGGAQTQVAVSGGGFPANTAVNVHLAGVAGVAAAAANPQSYATTTTDGNGNFNVSFALPDKWPDGKPITSGKLVVLVATADLGTVASATFDYFVAAPNPSIRLNPTSGAATTQVTANGGGFPANVTVNLHLGALDEQIGKGNAKVYASAKSDANGNYSLTFSVPAQWPNGTPIATDKIIVLVATEDFGVQVSSVFAFVLPPPTATNTPVPPSTPTNTPVPPPTATNTPVTPPTATPQPSVNLAPNTGGANQSVTVSGGGFPAGATLNVHLARPDHSGSPDAANFASTTSDGNGNFAVSLGMPQKWPNGDAIATGPIVILVATNDFGVQASAVFTYVAAAAAEAPPAVDTPTPEAPPTEPVAPSTPSS